MIRGIVFDFDGTLVDSNDIKRQAFYEVTKAYDPTGTIITSILTQFPKKDRHGVFEAFACELFAHSPTSSPKEWEILSTQWEEDYTIKCEEAIQNCHEVPGTSETLQWIVAQHIPIFINSRTPATTLRRLITLRSLKPHIHDIYGAPESKFDNLCQIQNQIHAQPKEILFVGDSEDDREAALAIDCQFVGVVLREKPRFSDPQPERCITNLCQLQSIIAIL